MMHPALFLDRDGVIIENQSNYVRAWADVEIYPQALQALAHVCHSPYKIILITNQSVVGRGIISHSQAEAVNERLVAEIKKAGGRIDAVFMCPHAPADECGCRKPKPGLLLRAAEQHAIDLSRSLMIGDALTDILAGKAAGVYRTILVKTGRGLAQSQLPQAANFEPLPVYETLLAALIALVPSP